MPCGGHGDERRSKECILSHSTSRTPCGIDIQVVAKITKEKLKVNA